MRAFHNQNVDSFLREVCTGNEGLVVKLYITRVEYGCAAFTLQFHSTAAKNMPRVMQGCQNPSAATNAE